MIKKNPANLIHMRDIHWWDRMKEKLNTHFDQFLSIPSNK